MEKVIVVDHSEKNEYGDLIVTDKEGKTHKVKAKRSELFPQFVDGRAVKLGLGEYKGYPYIAAAVLVDLPEQEARPTEAPKPTQVSPKPIQKVTEPSPQEKGMWWKELGEMLRAGDIDKTKPMGKALRDFYYTQMLSVLDITLESTHRE